MKVDVVDQEDARVLHRGEQARHFLGEGRDLLGGRALGGQARRRRPRGSVAPRTSPRVKPCSAARKLSASVLSAGGPPG